VPFLCSGNISLKIKLFSYEKYIPFALWIKEIK